jgi:tetratricopeptide (TPR) repeat protein
MTPERFPRSIPLDAFGVRQNGQFLAGRGKECLNRGMETPRLEEEGQPIHRLNVEEMRASLSAVRAAQAEARARNRRETLKARVLVGTAVVTFAVGVVATRTRAAHGSSARRPTVAEIAAPAVNAAPASVAPLGAAPPAPLEPPSPPVPAQISGPDRAGDASVVAECEALVGRHLWRQAAQPCALAVEARPNEAGLALALAQAEHARNRLADAEHWAQRAIALDPSLPEAFVIRAHAEAHAGDSRAAARDFRRYLSLAPRGWHAKEARAALRARQDDRDPRPSSTSSSSSTSTSTSVSAS